MKISTQNYNHQANFKAIKIAHTQNLCGSTPINIDIYRLTREDGHFLKKWSDSINFSKLFPKLNQLAIERWEKIFKYSIFSALDSQNISYLAVSDNRPCGIATYCLDRNSFYLDAICSVPIETDKKVKLAGKTLFYQIFRDAKKENARDITLDAVQNGPFDVVKKYEKLGFKKDPTTHPYTKMVCNKHKIATQLKEIPFEIDYYECEREKTNLLDFLD